MTIDRNMRILLGDVYLAILLKDFSLRFTNERLAKDGKLWCVLTRLGARYMIEVRCVEIPPRAEDIICQATALHFTNSRFMLDFISQFIRFSQQRTVEVNKQNMASFESEKADETCTCRMESVWKVDNKSLCQDAIS